MRTLVLFVLITAFVCPTFAQDGNFIILHTNDMHSRLNGFSPEANYSPLTPNDDSTVGGFARLQAAITLERAMYGQSVLLVDAGDFLMGSLFQTVETSTGFGLTLMSKMGYDAITLGNHEFDWGPQALAEIIQSAKDRGPIPPIVCTNLKPDATSTDVDGISALCADGTITPYHIIERNGISIGFIGILGYDAIRVSPRIHPVTFDDPLTSAKTWAKRLKEEMKVDMVICLSHSGLVKMKNDEWGGEDVELAKAVPEIDVIISGHTHTQLLNPIMMNGIPIVQAAANGTYLGRLELVNDSDSGPAVKGELLPIDDRYTGDPSFQQLIEDQEIIIDNEILRPLGLTYNDPVVETSFPLALGVPENMQVSNLGKLLADATFNYVNQLEGESTDISFFASGMIRDDMGVGVYSTADIFRVAALGIGADNVPGYPLAKVYVTAKELKGIMEILYLAPSMSSDNHVYFGGAIVYCNPKKGLLRKIVKIELGNDQAGYQALDLSKKNAKLYGITADVYLLEFFGMIKQLSKGLVKVTLKDSLGNPITDISTTRIDQDKGVEGIQEAKEWLAIHWYLSQFPDLDGNTIPDIPDSYRSVLPAMRLVSKK